MLRQCHAALSIWYPEDCIPDRTLGLFVAAFLRDLCASAGDHFVRITHMIHASMTNSRMQGDYRYSFWGGEVYETVLAWYIARPTTVALFAPHKGTFNVTAKGGLVEKSHYDWVISRPYLVLVALNILGFAVGIYRMGGWGGPQNEIGTVIVNLVWTMYNLLILGAAVAVAVEAKQVRKDHRVEVAIPVAVRLNSGHLIQAQMKDFSLGGRAHRN